MGSPLSAGDVIALAQIAYAIAKTFSSGAKSAPSEFAEVQTLLFSYSESLKLLARTLPDRSDSDRPDAVFAGDSEAVTVLVSIADRCRGVLKHLEDFVKKYSVLDGTSNEDGARRWKDDIKKNWKKVLWTTEGGDIAKLKQTLTAHINTLSLAVSILNGGKQDVIHGKISDVQHKLDDIYEWFSANLKKPQPQRGRASPSGDEEAVSESPAQDTKDEKRLMAFQIVEDSRAATDGQAAPICYHAIFDLDNLPSETRATSSSHNRRILRCCCREFGRREDHSSQLLFTILPVSLLVRVADSLGKGGDWQIYLGSVNSNSPVSLRLTQNSAVCLAGMERWASHLAVYQTSRTAANSQSTALIQRGQDTLSVLQMKASVTGLTPKLLAVCFSVPGSDFFADKLSSLQALHYGVVKAAAWSDQPATYSYERHANILIGRDGAGSERFAVQVDQDMELTTNKGPRFVAIRKVLCIHENHREHDSVQCSEVQFEFADPSAADEFFRTLESIKTHLFVQYLQHARQGELVVYQRQAGNLMIRNFFLQDAQLKIIVDSTTGRYRMVVLRNDHSASVTFELPPDFLETLASGTTSSTTNNYPAWFVGVGVDKVEVAMQRSGIDPFSGLSGDHEPMLRLALRGKQEVDVEMSGNTPES